MANLGLQARTAADHSLIAEVLRWFDLVAVQETNDDLSGLRGVLSQLPKTYRAVFSGAAGNNERLAFVYDAAELSVGEEIGGGGPRCLGLPPHPLGAHRPEVRGFSTATAIWPPSPAATSRSPWSTSICTSAPTRPGP